MGLCYSNISDSQDNQQHENVDKLQNKFSELPIELPPNLLDEKYYCQCPNKLCQSPIFKNGGCHRLFCPRCKKSFCFFCKTIFPNKAHSAKCVKCGEDFD